MPLVGLHECYLDADYLEAMAKQVDESWTRLKVGKLMAALTAAGLLRDTGQATYEMHPLLTSYVRSHSTANGTCQAAFVEIMGTVADRLLPRQHNEQSVPFLLYGANLHFAMQLAGDAALEQHFAAPTYAIAPSR